MSPFFSIIIPLYNKEDYIADTLSSALNQSFHDFEVIIVDDGTTDNSFKIASSFDDPRIRIFQQKNKGVSEARNYGIEMAQADLIAFLDADDIWLPNHLDILKSLFNDFPNAGLFCSRHKTKISKNKVIKHNFKGAIKDDFRGILPDFFKASVVDRVAHTSALAVHKQTISKYGRFDRNISSGQDLDLWIRIAAHCRVAISNKITCIYRFEIKKSLSKTPFLSKKLIDFKKYEALEKRNSSLKEFLDVYRLEYAIHYRIAGDILNSKYLLKEIESDIPFKSMVLLKLPPKFLQLLLYIKHRLRNIGVVFSIYN